MWIMRYIKGIEGKRTSTPEYTAYCNAFQRCTNEDNPRYPAYGGRGIQFLFVSFEQFLAAIGPRPSAEHSLERINNEGNYEPGNVKWATPAEQGENKRPRPSGLVYKGGKPVITIFVRHSKSCKYAGDEFCKRCTCRKHFRWSQSGQQFRRKAGTRSWAEAEERMRQLEAQLDGKPVEAQERGLLLSDAIEIFKANKSAEGLKPRVLAMYTRELARLLRFSESHNLLTVSQALTLENLIALRATWPSVYKSSYSRSVVQKHLNHFLRFAYDAGWIVRKPKLSAIKINEPETEPLTAAEYDTLLAHATGRIRAVIQLMRWSGLAIRDASTIKRTDIVCQGGMYKIVRRRTKTGTPLYIPLPPDVGAEVLAAANGHPVYIFWDRQSPTSSEYRHAGYVGEQVKAIFDKAGIQSAGHMISHRLRATFAVDLLSKGVALEHVSKLLGHRSVSTTERFYAKWVKSRQERLDSVVSATWGQIPLGSAEPRGQRDSL